ncbi:hypothetical protein ACQCT3_02200 [Sutcliffiella horikoshii]|uniref:hypothetical protein n=1 Tax=Sutcliffiella horikoshii TaxID=79883 RepID=UPI003CFB2CB5
MRCNHFTVALTSNGKQQVNKNGHKKPECHCQVASHKVRGDSQGLTGNIPFQVNLPGGAEDISVFEDYTDNHNKTLLQISAEPSLVEYSFSVLDVKIFTRDSDEPIEIRLSTNPVGPVYTGIPRGIQVENFVRLSVSNPLETIGTLRVYIEKTFCICCGEYSDASTNHIENHFVQGSGINQTGNIPILFPLRPNETEIIFSDDANNHNKTLIQLNSIGVFPFPPFPLQVFIFTKDSFFPIIAEVQGSELFGEGNIRAFQVENFSFLAIRFNDEVGLRQAAVEVFIQKTFCIGCGDR